MFPSVVSADVSPCDYGSENVHSILNFLFLVMIKSFLIVAVSRFIVKALVLVCSIYKQEKVLWWLFVLKAVIFV